MFSLLRWILKAGRRAGSLRWSFYNRIVVCRPGQAPGSIRKLKRLRGRARGLCTDTDTETVVIANKWCEFVHKIYRGTPRDVCQAVYDDLVSNPVQSKVTDYLTRILYV